MTTKELVTVESIANDYSHNIGALEAVFELYTELEVPTLSGWLQDIGFKFSGNATLKQFLQYVHRSSKNQPETTAFDPDDIGFGAFEAMLVNCYLTGGTIAYTDVMSAVEQLEDMFLLSVLERSFQEIKAVMQTRGFKSPGFARSPIHYA